MWVKVNATNIAEIREKKAINAIHGSQMNLIPLNSNIRSFLEENKFHI